MFLTSLKQTCSEYLIKFSENQSAPKLEKGKTSPCSPCAPNLPHVLLSRIPGYHNLCSPADRHTHTQTDRISSCRLDPFCRRGRVKIVLYSCFLLTELFGFRLIKVILLGRKASLSNKPESEKTSQVSQKRPGLS